MFKLEQLEKFFCRSFWLNKKHECQRTSVGRGRAALALLQVDNMEEVTHEMEKPDKLLFAAGVGKILEEWAKTFQAFIQKYENDKYLIFFDKHDLKSLEEDKFSILPKVRSLNFGNQIPLTISVGIGLGTADFAVLGNYAETALNIALGRGGDQVVIKENADLRFYGAKTQAIEKRSQVKVRVMAHALLNLICQSDKIIIAGHRGMDFDSLGSCLAILRICQSYNRDSKIILDDPPSDSFHKMEKFFAVNDAYGDIFLTGKEACDWISSDTLLVMVDSHKADILVEPELVNLTKRIVVLDHHRQSGEFSFEPLLVYLEPCSSSVSEILTEIINYLPEVKLNRIEANALLAGITLDTKNFSVQTGSRTFEAASRLRNWDAEPLLMRRLFKKSRTNLLKQIEVVKNIEILYNSIAIGVYTEKTINAQVLAAQAADLLVNIEDIEASFVLNQNDNGVVISARSAGRINVQLIMEEMGGGGHLLMAATQCIGLTLEEAKARLLPIIEAYWKEVQKQ